MITGLISGEQAVYQALQRLGKKEGVDFTYQPAVLGGRMEVGGLEAQFLFSNPPGLAINVHEQASPPSILRRIELAAWGITLVELDEAEVLQDPIYHVEAALRQGALGG